jgi:hypothetical protein
MQFAVVRTRVAHNDVGTTRVSAYCYDYERTCPLKIETALARCIAIAPRAIAVVLVFSGLFTARRQTSEIVVP